MKRISLLVVSAVLCISAFSQSITSLAIIPTPSTPSDDLKLVAVTSYPGGPCSYVNSYPNTQNGNTITMQPIYCFESASGGCSRTDTLSVGQLTSGSYTISFEVLSTTNPGPCGSQGYLLKAIQQLNFTVGGTTDIRDETAEIVKFFPNPVKDFVTFSMTNELANAEILIFSATGALVKTVYPNGKLSREVDLSNLREGIYLYTIVTDELVHSSKFIVAH